MTSFGLNSRQYYLVSAISFAAENTRARDERDMAETPCINQLIDVAKASVDCDVPDTGLLIAAVLHDTV